jgi:hypothetical protein
MHLSQTWRRWVGCASAGLLGMAVAAIGATPAQASLYWFTRHQNTSGYNANTTKSITVSCPDGEQVHSTGGRVNGGNGGVALAAIVPNSALTSVTARGEARAGHIGSWSVTAFAVCANPENLYTHPVRVGSGPLIGSIAIAGCPGGKFLTGVGYDVLSSPAFVDRVEPNAALNEVTVTARGSGIFVAVMGYGICSDFGIQQSYDLVPGESAFDDTSPKTAETTYPVSPVERQTIFALGGKVNGGAGNVLLDAMYPQNDFLAARATAAVALPPPSIGGPQVALRAGTDTGDDWSTVAYADYVDWY